MTFLAPMLLGGLALASVPIIIHLLNRRRFRLVEWGPMHYLKLTLKTNRRRLRLEQWLLLAVRTLAVIALFLAVARPAVSGTALGSWLAGRSRTTRVLVLDDSLSTDARGGGRSAFDRGQEAAAAIVDAIGSQDSVTVLTTSAPDRPLAREVYLEDPAELIGSIRSLKPVHSSNRWAATFAALDTHLKTSPFPLREITLVTDLRAEGWGPEVTAVADRWAADGVRMRIVDAGAEPGPNVALLALEQDRPAALVDEKTHLTARLRNDGPEAIAAGQAVLTVDGEPRPLVLPDLQPGQTLDVPLTVTFTVPGTHAVQLSLPPDALPMDNYRSLMVDVRKTVDVLLVDGEPGAGPFQSETDFLAVAFSVGRTPWNVTRVIDSEWLGNPLAGPDVMVLANVASITEERVAELEEQVEAGMGLMIFLGGQVDPEGYNRLLHRDGAGLLPVKIGPAAEATDAAVAGLVVEPLGDSPLNLLAKVAPKSLARIRPVRFAQIGRPAGGAEGGQVRVLARWNDPEETPAVVEKRLGRGRVVLWNITADRAWSDWPTDPIYVLACREAALTIAGGSGQALNLTAGTRLRQPLDPSRLPLRGSLTVPGAAQPVTLPVENPGRAGAAFAYGPTHTAGQWTLEWEEPGGGTRSTRFALNPDSRESDLAPITHERLTEMLGGLRPEIVRFDEGAEERGGQSKELWRTLAIVMGLLLLCETGLAAWVDRGRQ